MLLFGDRKYIKSPFDNENELEQVIVLNYEYLFGPSSFYLPKSKITTLDGKGTIPDGFVIDIDQRVWYIVEVELISHGVYEHIVPQITKQFVASSNPKTKQKIEDLAATLYTNDEITREKFNDALIDEIDVRKILGEILQTAPIVGMPIDEVNNDLREWSSTFKTGMKIWEVKKFVELGNPTNIVFDFPEEFKPQIDTKETEDESKENELSSVARYDVTVLDLIKSDMICPSDKLFMSYKPRNGNIQKYEAIILPDGAISFLEQIFSSPSMAAIAGIQDAGSERKTVNGWTSWKTADGKLLSELREIFINKQADPEKAGVM